MSENIKSSSIIPDILKDNSDQIGKKDLEIILEVNKKAIEIQMDVANQNEETIAVLENIKILSENIIKNYDNYLKELENKNKEINEKLDELIIYSSDNEKSLFKMQVLFGTTIISLIIQMIQLFLKK